MRQKIAHITLVVRDYDEAINFYVEKLGFQLVEDTELSSTKRWVLVRPPGEEGASLLLAEAADDTQRKCIGNQSGGRVFLFLFTDDFERAYKKLLDNNVRIIRPPSLEAFGKVAVFEDLYGNRWDLLEPENGWKGLPI